MNDNFRYIIIEEVYIKFMIVCIFNLYVIYKVLMFLFRKKNIYTAKYAVSDFKKYVKANQKKVNVFMLVLCSLFLYLCIYLDLDNIREIPSILKNKYSTGEFVLEKDQNYGSSRRYLNLKNLDTQEKIGIDVYYDKVYAGECFKINYYPNFHIGTIVEKIDCNTRGKIK